MERYSLKKDYYDQLWQDYYKNGKRSFVFQYLEKHPRSDTCFRMVLRQKWEELEAESVSSLDYVEYIVKKLSKTPKLYQEGEDYKLILPLLRYGLMLSQEEYQILESTGRKKDFHEKLLLLECQICHYDEDTRKGLSKIPRDTLENMTRQLEMVSLQVEVQNFFYEIGLPISDTNKPQKEGPTKKRLERKKDSTLNMLDAYCDRMNLSLFAASTNMRKGHEEDYEQFFQKLLKSGKSDVMIPLFIDSQTGTALFIIGKKYIYDFRYLIHLKNNRNYTDYCCSYGILEMDLGGTMNDLKDEGDYQGMISYRVLKYRFNYREAWEEYEITRREDLKNIRSNNSSLGEIQHPKTLDIYFAREERVEKEKQIKGENIDKKFLEIKAEAGLRENFGRSKRL